MLYSYFYLRVIPRPYFACCLHHVSDNWCIINYYIYTKLNMFSFYDLCPYILVVSALRKPFWHKRPLWRVFFKPGTCIDDLGLALIQFKRSAGVHAFSSAHTWSMTSMIWFHCSSMKSDHRNEDCNVNSSTLVY